MTSLKGKQLGSTLVVALIMLVLLTLFAVTSFNTANVNSKVVGNM
jgi:Tfp pilus assembly protein PilX